MTAVQTVRGPLEASRLGPTLMHEHLALKSPGIAESWPERWDHAAAVRAATARLRRLFERGVRSVVDLTPPDLGRDLALLREVQERSPVNLIVCTGVYWHVPLYWWSRTPDEMAEAFAAEIERGIAGSPVRAAILKVASDDAFPDPPGAPRLNERCLRAVARAHRATGAPISTHTGPPERALEQLRVFEQEDVDLSRVVFGHVGDSDDLGLLRRLMDGGSTVGMDRFGYHRLRSQAERIDTVVRLCAEGYADRMVLSHDAICHTHYPVERFFDPAPNRETAFDLIPDEILPALRERGVGEASIRQMLEGNPRRIFERGGS